MTLNTSNNVLNPLTKSSATYFPCIIANGRQVGTVCGAYPQWTVPFCPWTNAQRKRDKAQLPFLYFFTLLTHFILWLGVSLLSAWEQTDENIWSFSRRKTFLCKSFSQGLCALWVPQVYNTSFPIIKPDDKCAYTHYTWILSFFCFL